MIEAAERLVAERGFAALTVQAVQRAAGQRNKSAVQYHFGGRQELVNAVVAARMAPTNRRRTEMLLALGEDASLRDLVEILVVPLVESVLARQPSYWARFLLQTSSEPATGMAALASVDDPALVAIHRRLEARLHGLPEPLRRLRVRAAFGYACLVLAVYEVGVLPPQFSGESLATELVDACCGLLCAASTNESLAPSRATEAGRGAAAAAGGSE